VWVELSEDAEKCKEVESACDSITAGKIECETPGAAVSPTDGTLSCVWLDGNDTRDPKVEAQCKVRVCLWGLFSFGY
jgi:hypothetical protein